MSTAVTSGWPHHALATCVAGRNTEQCVQSVAAIKQLEANMRREELLFSQLGVDFFLHVRTRCCCEEWNFTRCTFRTCTALKGKLAQSCKLSWFVHMTRIWCRTTVGTLMATACTAQVLTPLQGAKSVVSMYPWIPDKLAMMNAIAEQERDAASDAVQRLATC